MNSLLKSLIESTVKEMSNISQKITTVGTIKIIVRYIVESLRSGFYLETWEGSHGENKTV